MKTLSDKRKTMIIRYSSIYWQVIDDKGNTIGTAHSYKQAVKIKRNYDFKQISKKIIERR